MNPMPKRRKTLVVVADDDDDSQDEQQQQHCSDDGNDCDSDVSYEELNSQSESESDDESDAYTDNEDESDNGDGLEEEDDDEDEDIACAVEDIRMINKEVDSLTRRLRGSIKHHHGISKKHTKKLRQSSLRILEILSDFAAHADAMAGLSDFACDQTTMALANTIDTKIATVVEWIIPE